MFVKIAGRKWNIGVIAGAAIVLASLFFNVLILLPVGLVFGIASILAVKPPNEGYRTYEGGYFSRMAKKTWDRVCCNEEMG